MPKERPDETPQEEKGYTPASPVKRTLAWIGLAYALLFLGPLLAVPGLIGLGALSLVSWRTTGRPKKGAAWLLALLCWAAALVSLPMGLVGLLSNFGVVFTV